MIEVVPEYTDIQKTSLDETGWKGFNTPHSSNVGQTYGPAGMGIGAYMDRPETKPGFVPFKKPKPGYDSAVGTSMQTYGPAGMGIGAYMDRPESQPGFTPFMSPSNFRKQSGLKQVAGLDDVLPWMKNKAWPWIKETGKGMYNQIPFTADELLDPFPGFESPYFAPALDEEGDEIAGMDDSLQSLQRQLDELDPTNPDHLDLIELLNSDIDMKYPWAQQALNLQDVMDMHELLGLPLNTDRFMKRANKAGVQVAELTEDQMNMMGNPLNTPDFGVSKEDLWDRTKGMEDQGFFGWGAQEPTTREEFEDYYRQLQEGTVGNWVT